MNSSALQKAVQYALICAIVVFASWLLFYLTDFAFVFFGLAARLVLGLIFFIVFIFIMMNWKKGQQSVTYGEAFKFGLKAIAFYVVFMFVFDLIFMYLIAPEFNQAMMVHTLESMNKMGVPEAQLDETRAQFEKGLNQPQILGAAYGLAFRAVLDIIVLLIVAAFTRKEKELLSPPLN